MNRLSNYLVGLFARDAAALFAVATFIMFLAQCLRVVDTGAVRGQGLGVLMLQALLAMPPVMVSFLFICVAIGLARALRALQATHELHIIHGGQRLSVLLWSILSYTLTAAVLVLLLTHFVAPAATREGNLIRANIAADLVGRSLVPNRFAEVGDGVTITVGGRKPDGEITSFFADDRRSPEVRRSYIADSALLTVDDEGYVLQLVDGTIQYLTREGQFSEISFNRYDIALERLTGQTDTGERRGDNSSLALLANALESGEWPIEAVQELSNRTIEGLRVIALCLFVAAIAAFPSGRRRDPILPIEIIVLVVAFIERGISTYAPGNGVFAPATGSVVLLALATIILIFRLRVFAAQPREVHSR